jgi:hypothetical protein
MVSISTSSEPLTEKQISDYVHRIGGRLMYKGDDVALHDIKVRVYAKNFFGQKQYLGSARTDENGQFTFTYKWKPGYFSKNHHLTLGIVGIKRPFSDKGLTCAKSEVALQKIEKTIPVNVHEIDFKDIPVDFAMVPPNITDVIKPPATHEQSFRWKAKLFVASFLEVIKRVVVKLFGWMMSSKSVQGLYSLFGTKYPVRKLTEKNIINELLNEISAVDYRVKGNQVTWSANWDGLNLDIKDSLPNVDVVAETTENGGMKLKRISIRYREDEKATVATPTDKNFRWAAYIARSTFALKGEAEVHLGLGHVLPHIVAKPLFKYLSPQNPIFKLVAPHLGQVHNINYLGSKGIIYGEGSVLETSALDSDAVTRVIVNTLHTKANYMAYEPKEPLCDNHHLAKVQKEYFKQLHEYFTKYVEGNKEELTKYWKEIYTFSTKLHKRFNKIPKITTSPDGPQPGDLQRLSKLMAWVVNLTTFHHWAAHSRQNILADIRSCSLAIQHRALNKDNTFNEYGNTSVQAANTQNFISRTLLNWDGDKMVDDPYKNMDPGLLRIIQLFVKKVEGTHSGFPHIRKMHVATQI